jgi:aryl-alcohol dehydrogenase-like predicted oxidoreductase
MEYRTVGATGVRVSPLCVGTMAFGADADEQTSTEMFHRVREAGINFFDTADVYAGGASEEILGKLVAHHRDEVVLASKVFHPTGQDPTRRGCRAGTSSGPRRRACAGWVRAGSTSTSSTPSMSAPRSRRRCAPWTTCSGRGRSSTRR